MSSKHSAAARQPAKPATPLIEVGDGWVRYLDRFLAADEADRFFVELRSQVAWEQFRNHLWTFPRLTAFAADADIEYRYSGVTHRGRGWIPPLLALKQRVEQTSGAPFNGVLMNLYRDGNDSMGRHADAEPELGANPLVASLSLGAVRRFVLHHTDSSEKLRFDLAHGSLLVMGGTLQHHWVHELPKTKQSVGERINLTFRRFLLPSRKS